MIINIKIFKNSYIRRIEKYILTIAMVLCSVPNVEANNAPQCPKLSEKIALCSVDQKSPGGPVAKNYPATLICKTQNKTSATYQMITIVDYDGDGKYDNQPVPVDFFPTTGADNYKLTDTEMTLTISISKAVNPTKKTNPNGELKLILYSNGHPLPEQSARLNCR